MKDSKNNLKFEYLFRDSGNFKTFGELIFSNPRNLDSSIASSLLKDKLIDKEYFYPEKAGVPKFTQCDFELDTVWYEFIGFSISDEVATENISADEFISRFQAL